MSSFLLRLLPSVFWNTYRTRNEKSTPPLIESQRVRIQASTVSWAGSIAVSGAMSGWEGGERVGPPRAAKWFSQKRLPTPFLGHWPIISLSLYEGNNLAYDKACTREVFA